MLVEIKVANIKMLLDVKQDLMLFSMMSSVFIEYIVWVLVLPGELSFYHEAKEK